MVLPRLAMSAIDLKDIRQRYTPFLPWAGMLALAGEFGLPEGVVRKWVQNGHITPSPLPCRAKWRREQVLTIITDAQNSH